MLIISIFAYLLFVRGLRFGKQLAFTGVGVVILTSFIIWSSPLTPSDLLPAEYFQSRSANIITKLSSIFSPVLNPNGISNQNRAYDPQPDSNLTLPQTGPNEPATDTLNMRTFILGMDYHISQDFRQVIIPIGLGEGKTLTNFLNTQELLKIFGYLISGFVFIGVVILFVRKKFSIFILSAFLYLAALMLWVWDGPRLLYPILPQMQFCFIMGIGWVISIFTSSSRIPVLHNKSNLILATVVLILGSFSIYKSLRIDDSYFHAGDVQARTDWLRGNVEGTASIMTEYPEVDYIYANRKTILYPYSSQISSSNALETYLVRNQVNYILVAPQISWQPKYSASYSDWTKQLLPYIDDLTNKNELVLVYESKQNLIKIYQRPN